MNKNYLCNRIKFNKLQTTIKQYCFNQKKPRVMKRKFLITFFITALFLIVMPPGKYIKAYEKQTIEALDCEQIIINDVQFEIAKDVNPVMIVEVEISPGDQFEGVYNLEGSKEINLSNDDNYALNYDIKKRFINSQFLKSCVNYNDNSYNRQVTEFNSDENRIIRKEVEGQPLSNTVFKT